MLSECDVALAVIVQSAVLESIIDMLLEMPTSWQSLAPSRITLSDAGVGIVDVPA